MAEPGIAGAGLQNAAAAVLFRRLAPLLAVLVVIVALTEEPGK